MEQSDTRRTNTNENQIVTYASKDVDNYIKNEYNFEIELSCFQKVLVIKFKYFDRRNRNNISTFFK